jgi:signal transduction histidine kinase
MSRWVWTLMVVASTVAAFVLDRRVQPDHVNYALYAAPMLLASVRWSPEAVLTWAVGCLLLAIFDFSLGRDTTMHGAAGLAALLVVALLATTSAFHRQEAQRKIRQQQAVIDAVQRLRQPLAVILGYTQLLAARPPSAPMLARGLDAVCRAAVDLRAMLDAILARRGAV